eukprot:1447346-Rhodomonas_salina.1
MAAPRPSRLRIGPCHTQSRKLGHGLRVSIQTKFPLLDFYWYYLSMSTTVFPLRLLLHWQNTNFNVHVGVILLILNEQLQSTN